MSHDPLTPQNTSPVNRIRHAVTRPTTSGALLLGAAVLALIWANSPWRQAYHALADLHLGVGPWTLSLSHWAADGLLAVFFFVVGVELKQELTSGSLANPREAGVPMIAALGGMIAPAAVYLLVINLAGDSGASRGWGIPTATDIAFALAVLAVFGRGLPAAVRTFLLTLAVVDDLLAIIVIAVAYTDGVTIGWLIGALVAVAGFAYLVRVKRPRWWLLWPVALVAWALMYRSGVHATVAGALLGFMIPAQAVHNERSTRAHHYEQALAPVSYGFALPVFAFFAAGVSVVGAQPGMLWQPVTLAIVVALVVGKLVGVLGVTAVVVRFTPLRLSGDLVLRDLLPVGFLAGIGFTVALLIAQLSFDDPTVHDAAQAAVLIGSFVSGGLAALSLGWDARKARRVGAGPT